MTEFDNHDYPRSSVNLLATLTQRLATEPAVLVTVAAAHGSVPREVGAWMAVFAQGEVGTIGGGQLEWHAMAQSRQALQGLAVLPPPQRVALGPSLGQCCGGAVELSFAAISAKDMPLLQQRLMPMLTPVALFGGGHVGRALVEVLSLLLSPHCERLSGVTRPSPVCRHTKATSLARLRLYVVFTTVAVEHESAKAERARSGRLITVSSGPCARR